MNHDQLTTLVDHLFEDISAFQRGRLITTASSMNLFNRFSGEYRSIGEVKRKSEDKEGLKRFCDALTGLGLLQKKGENYRCTEISELLFTDHAEFDLRPILRLQHRGYEMWSELDRAVKKGQAIKFKTVGKGLFNPKFIHAMEARAHFRKEEMAQELKKYIWRGKVLDLGGGSGIFIRELLKIAPGATGVVADLPGVIKVAESYIKEDKLQKRLKTEPLDIINDNSYGKGYDLILIAAILHIFGPPKNKRILKKTYKALKPKGKVVIMDYIMNDEHSLPHKGSLFGIHMMLATSEGNVYSETQYRDWLKRAGFKKIRKVTLQGQSDLMIAEK
ncbi:MAG: methyltransferase domain-containing protein [Bacteroidetes bacterium]|nr:methyltransferase domain-containing protein [Bacteroidota bacterium]